MSNGLSTISTTSKADQDKLTPSQVESKVLKLVHLLKSHLQKVARVKNETGTKNNVHPYDEPVRAGILPSAGLSILRCYI